MSFRFLIFCIVVVVAGLVMPSYGSETLPRVATFKADITLPIGHPCYVSYKPIKTIEHPLFAKGIVIEVGKTKDRYVICTFDWCEICNGSHDKIREKIAKAVKTTPDRVAVLSVHQHTAPMAVGDAQRLLDKIKGAPKAWDLDVLNGLFDKVAKAAGASVEKLQPFNQVGTSEAKVDRIASNRRILGEDGKVTMRWSRCKDPKLIAKPEGVIDPMLKTITLAHDGKPIVRMHYYAAHPQSFYGDARLSYDFVGMARERLEKEDGVPQIYFTGCCGNITVGKYNDGTRKSRDAMTERLFDAMRRSVATTKYDEVGPICWRTTSLIAAAQYPDKAKAYEKKMGQKKQKRLKRIDAAQNLAFLKRVEKPFFLCSLELGKVSMVYLSGEPCIAYQFYAQKAKPENFVAVSGYADGGCGYICTEDMFPKGGYEPSVSRFAAEVEKELRAAIDSLLGKEKKGKKKAAKKSNKLKAKPEVVDAWRKLKFGLFVHWDPVSQKGTKISWSRIGPQTKRNNRGVIPPEEYDILYKTFNPVKFDADEWIQITKDSGMKYIVFTSKHHAGFCNFDSKWTDHKITSPECPYGKDIVKQLADACHKGEVLFGLYYSQPDWHHPDYLTKSFWRDKNRHSPENQKKWKRHQKYITYLHRQLRELMTNYGKVDILFFDGLGGREKHWKGKKLIRMCRELQPDIIINNRCGIPGDYDTPEQRIGKMQTKRPWETCVTLGTQWAWKPNDKIKSFDECIKLLVNVVGGDGNLLLNVGPRSDGLIEPNQVARLREIGAWLKKYGESIYDTRGGPFLVGDWGASTYRGNTVYLHILDKTSKTVNLPSINRKIVSYEVLTGGSVDIVRHALKISITVSPKDPNEPDAIIKIELDGPASEVKIFNKNKHKSKHEKKN